MTRIVESDVKKAEAEALHSFVQRVAPTKCVNMARLKHVSQLSILSIMCALRKGIW